MTSGGRDSTKPQSHLIFTIYRQLPTNYLVLLHACFCPGRLYSPSGQTGAMGDYKSAKKSAKKVRSGPYYYSCHCYDSMMVMLLSAGVVYLVYTFCVRQGLMVLASQKIGDRNISLCSILQVPYIFFDITFLSNIISYN